MVNQKSVTIASVLVTAIAIVIVGGLFFFNDKSLVPRMAEGLDRKVTEEPSRTNYPVGTLTSEFATGRMVANSRLYTYYWFEPGHPWPDDARFPLVLVLHDESGTATAGRYLISGQTPFDHPAFIMIPTIGPNRLWAEPPAAALPPDAQLDAAYGLPDIIDMVRQISESFPVDKNRIYVIGCSEGGTATYAAMRYYPDVFAAAVPLAADWNPEDAVNLTQVPAWVFNGEVDSFMPPEKASLIAEIARSRGGAIRYTGVSRVAHDCNSPFFYAPEIINWMFAQRRP